MWLIYIFFGLAVSALATYLFRIVVQEVGAQRREFAREADKSRSGAIWLFLMNFLMYLSGLAASLFAPEIRHWIGF